ISRVLHPSSCSNFQYPESPHRTAACLAFFSLAAVPGALGFARSDISSAKTRQPPGLSRVHARPSLGLQDWPRVCPRHMWSNPPPLLCQNPHAGNTLPPPSPVVTNPSPARDGPRRPFLFGRRQHLQSEIHHRAVRLVLDRCLVVRRFRQCLQPPGPLV